VRRLLAYALIAGLVVLAVAALVVIFQAGSGDQVLVN